MQDTSPLVGRTQYRVVMQIEYGKIEGDLVLDDDLKLHGMLCGNLTVPAGCKVWLHGMVTGDLRVEPDGAAVVHGMVCGDVLAEGPTTIFGTVSGGASGPKLKVDPGAVIQNQ